jgi:hypothetical protein
LFFKLSSIRGTVLLRIYLARVKMLFVGRRLRKYLLKQNSSKKVILGAGSTSKSGWVSSDIVNTNNYYLNFKKRWGISNQLTAIYGDMILASLTRQELDSFFRSCHEALVPGGKIRFNTLDFSRIAKLYLEDSNETQLLLKRHKARGFLGDYPIDLIFHAVCAHESARLGKPVGSYLHDETVLRNALKSAGFLDIQSHPANKSSDKVFADLEVRKEPIEEIMQFAIEASKAKL